MDVSWPVRSVIPSLDGPILMALAGTSRPMRLTEISALVEVGSLSGVRKALLRLTDQGVVELVPGGYVLNRDHLAARAVMELASMRIEFTSRLSDFAASLSEPPVLMALFGSYARRDGDSGSDIDILLVTDSPDAGERAGELADRVRRWTGNHCGVVALSVADVWRMRAVEEPILSEWTRDLIVIAGSRDSLGV